MTDVEEVRRIEEKDKNDILRYTYVFTDNEQSLIEDIINKYQSPSSYTFCLPIVPPKRCSDRVRRGLRDYIDYLFQDSVIEDIINEANTNRTLYKVELQCISVDVVQVCITF